LDRGIETRSQSRIQALVGVADPGKARTRYGVAMGDSGDGLFHKGQPVWVIEEGGSRRAAGYLGESETTAWFGGKVAVMVVYEDTRTGATVDADRVTPRDP
jgi:hypothetical protein